LLPRFSFHTLTYRRNVLIKYLNYSLQLLADRQTECASQLKLSLACPSYLSGMPDYLQQHQQQPSVGCALFDLRIYSPSLFF